MARDPASWIGRTETREDRVSEALAQMYASTLEDLLAPSPPGEAPGLFHWCLCPPLAATSELATDGHPSTSGLLPKAPLPRRVWAGGEIIEHFPLRIGDAVQRTSRVALVEEKCGRNGPIIFVGIEHRWTCKGTLALEERQDLAFREAATSHVPAAHAPSRGDRPHDLRRTIRATPQLLFRYSALTFNSHRIHYDAPYACEVEKYPGLVVQGPLQATLLHAITTKLLGNRPRRFTYRGTAPLIAGGNFHVSAGWSGECFVSDSDGRITMEGQATQ